MLEFAAAEVLDGFRKREVGPGRWERTVAVDGAGEPMGSELDILGGFLRNELHCGGECAGRREQERRRVGREAT